MPRFASVVDYDDARTSEQNATRRGPDYLVRVPNGHPFFGIGSSYFRQDGAAVPPAGAAAVVAVILDCMPLSLLGGLGCGAVAGPPSEQYGRIRYPLFPARVPRPRCRSGGLWARRGSFGHWRLRRFGSFTQRKWWLGGAVGGSRCARASPGCGPLLAAAFAAMENPGDPASRTAPFTLSSSAFSDLADEDGCIGAYAALRLASGRENLRKMRSMRAQPGVFAFPRNERH